MIQTKRLCAALRPGIAATALVLVAPLAALAQTGTIQGTVLDTAAALVPGAKVAAVDEDKQLLVREAASGADGVFYLRNLLPGTYTVKVEMTGFKTIEQTGIKLDQNQIIDMGPLKMELGSTSESVTVEATVPLVETSTAQKSFVISSRQVTELSLNGRDFQSLMRTLPGVVTNNASDFRLAFNSTDQFNVNGMRGSANNAFLDGSVNTDVGANDGQYTQISLDAVGEFKVQTSTFNAEYGRNPGVYIAINTKSGGTSFHGTLYEFLRNDFFDARRPFDTTGKPSIVRFNQFGGNIGGPIVLPRISPASDKKLFFFVNIEKTLGSRPLGNNYLDVVHPDLFNGDLSRLYRSGFIKAADNVTDTPYRIGQIFRPGTVVRAGTRIIGGDPYVGNVIPRSEWSKNAPAFIKVLQGGIDRSIAQPLPNNPELLRFPYQQIYQLDKLGKVARIDYNISPSTTFFFRWADDSQHEEQTKGIFTQSDTMIQPQFREKPGASWSWNIINVIKPTLTNEAVVTYNHLTQVVDLADSADPNLYDKDKLGFTYQDLYPESNLRNRYPRFNCNMGNCNYGGFASGWLSEGITYAVNDVMTWNKGSHTFKWGGLWNRNDNGQQPSWTDTVNFNFGSSVDNPGDTGHTFANMLLGNYTSITQSNGWFYGSYRFYGYELFAQDSWKITPRFTLEYGVRWAYLGPTYTHGKFLAPYWDPNRYDPSKAAVLNNARAIVAGDPFNGIVTEGDPGVPKGWSKHRWNNWAPRLGFAWDPFGDGKTSIRGGGGLFYERIRQNTNNFGVLGNPPQTYNPTIFGGRVDDVSPALVQSGVRFPVGVTAWDQEGQIPTVYAWSFGIQRELGARTALDVSYVGNAGRHLQYRRNLNQAVLGTTTTPGVLASVGNVQDRLRPYQGFTDINYMEFGSISNYNALQARLNRRFGRGFTGSVNYAWSKAMNENDVDGDVVGYKFDRAREYARAGYDRKQTLSFDWVYELPQVGSRASSHWLAKGLLDGWQTSGMARFWTGRPWNLRSNQNTGAIQMPADAQRPDYIGGSIEPTVKDRYNYYNIFAFARPQEGTLGNLGRNAITGPGINQWDLSLFKNTRVSEGVTLQLRLESFNTFNHTQWDTLNQTLNAPNPGAVPNESTRGQAGWVTDTRDPRSVQLGVKLLF